MSLPILLRIDWDWEYLVWNEDERISNCSECKITESVNDFSLSMSIVGRSSINVNDRVRVKHLDGNWYDFKVDSVSYSGGAYSVSAKYVAYETGGIVNEPIVGMYTPKGMIDYLNAHLHGPSRTLDEEYPISLIDTVVSCDVTDRYCGISCTNNQLFRNTLYAQVVGATGFYFIPYQYTGLKLVESRGKSHSTTLYTDKDVTSFSYERKATSKPNDVITYIDWPSIEHEEYADECWSTASNPINGDFFGASEYYDATNDLGDTYLVGEDSVVQMANKYLRDGNSSKKSIETTIHLDLSKDAPLLGIGDPISFDASSDQLNEVINDIGNWIYSGPYSEAWNEVKPRVSQLEYDVLNECMISIDVGDISSDVSDIIASQNKSIQSNKVIADFTPSLYADDFDENNEAEVVIPRYNNGDVVLLVPYGGNPAPHTGEGEVDDDGVYHPYNLRVVSIDGNVFRLKSDYISADTEMFVSVMMYYIQRTEQKLYDNGDLCDNTWSNYSTSYLSFDATKISLKSGGAARACTTNSISLLGYKRLVIEYAFTTYKAVKIGFNATSSTAASNPNMFYCTLAKGGTKASVEIPDDYAESNGYLKIYGTSGAVGQITKIYLQSK